MPVDGKAWLTRWALSAAGVIIAAHTSSGISYGGDYGVLAVAVVLLSALSVLLKPLLVLFALPFIILTFGLGLWVLNALLFYLVGELVHGFDVTSFGAALWGAFWVSLAHLAGSLRFRKTSSQATPPHPNRNDNDIIDI